MKVIENSQEVRDIIDQIESIICNKGTWHSNGTKELIGVIVSIRFVRNNWMSIITSKKVKIFFTAAKGIVFSKGTLEDLQDILMLLKLVGG